jgi:hypothetical protein
MSTADQIAQEVFDARARLIAFAEGCSPEQWESVPLGETDPRAVSVIIDHVAHSYEYIGGWVGTLVEGGTVDVDTDFVDGLNAEHAAGSQDLEIKKVTAHLIDSGDALIALLRRLTPDALSIGNGRVERLAQIASRHADGHRSELESALGA